MHAAMAYKVSQDYELFDYLSQLSPEENNVITFIMNKTSQEWSFELYTAYQKQLQKRKEYKLTRFAHYEHRGYFCKRSKVVNMLLYTLFVSNTLLNILLFTLIQRKCDYLLDLANTLEEEWSSMGMPFYMEKYNFLFEDTFRQHVMHTYFNLSPMYKPSDDDIDINSDLYYNFFSRAFIDILTEPYFEDFFCRAHCHVFVDLDELNKADNAEDTQIQSQYEHAKKCDEIALYPMETLESTIDANDTIKPVLIGCILACQKNKTLKSAHVAGRLFMDKSLRALDFREVRDVIRQGHKMDDRVAKIIMAGEGMELMPELMHCKLKLLQNTPLAKAYSAMFARARPTFSTAAVSAETLSRCSASPLRRPEFGTVGTPNVTAILANCVPSMFGKGGETLLDETVRRSKEIDHYKFSKEDIRHFDKIIEQQSAAAIAEVFGENVYISFDKLVVYEAGDHFDVHRDTPGSSDHIGTVVVTLGSEFEGGALVLLCDNKEIRVCDTPMSVAAFYTDIKHKVVPCTSGTRIVLTAKVFVDDEPDYTWEEDRVIHGQSIDLMADEADELNEQTVETFIYLLKKSKRPSIVLGCYHMIPAAAVAEQINGLRGHDQVIAKQLVNAGFKVRVTAVIMKGSRKMEEAYEDQAEAAFYLVSDAPSKTAYIRPSVGLECHVLVDHEETFHGNHAEPGCLQYVSTALLIDLI